MCFRLSYGPELITEDGLFIFGDIVKQMAMENKISPETYIPVSLSNNIFEKRSIHFTNKAILLTKVNIKIKIKIITFPQNSSTHCSICTMLN